MEKNSDIVSTLAVDFDNFSFEQETLASTLPIPKIQTLKCLESISPSHWNPPPFTRKLQGDLFYVSVTVEKIQAEITCCASGFYFNNSTNLVFTPELPHGNEIYDTIIELLSGSFPSFKKMFELQEAVLANVNPFDYILTSSPSLPWIVTPETISSDPGHLLDSILSSALDSQFSRDWNEDIQSARGIRKVSGPEHIIRDNTMFRSHVDFIDAATRAGIAAVERSISPINPQDDEGAQMFIHNNIFISQGYDGQEVFEMYGGEAAAHVAVSKDINGIGAVAHLDLEGICILGTALIDYKGHRLVAQTIVPGILMKSEGQGPPIKYGSVDAGIQIASDETFALVAEEPAKLLHLSPHEVMDEAGKSHRLFTSVETKGVLGTDSRNYLMDLYRLTPVDICFQEMVEKDFEVNPYPHKMTLLRHELITTFYEFKMREAIVAYQEKLKTEPEATPIEKMNFEFKKCFNPDSFTLAKLGDSVETVEADEAFVRELSAFSQRLLSQLILDIIGFTQSVPLDSTGLTQLFHRRGLNMRYLGKVANLFEQIPDFPVSFFHDLCVEEMVARSAKGILRQYLKHTPIELVQPCVSHFLNCLFLASDSDIGEVDTKKSDHVMEWVSLTPFSLQNQIKITIQQRFRYNLLDDSWKSRNVPLLRSICLKIGIQMEAKDYSFVAATMPEQEDGFVVVPVLQIFSPGNILNIYPIVKHSTPRAAFAEEAMDHGKELMTRDAESHHEYIMEALSIYEQVYGPVHPDTGRAYATAAMLHSKEKKFEDAVAYQRRAVLVSERTLGCDDGETLRQYVLFS